MAPALAEPEGRSAPLGRRVTRRFYWGPAPAGGVAGVAGAALLCDVRLEPLWRALRDVRPQDALRIACAVELGERTAIAPILRARAALARLGVALDVWPRLADGAGGPCLNTTTAALFQGRLLPLLDELARSADGADVGLALDVEPHDGLAEAAWSAGDASQPLVSRARAMGALARGVLHAVVAARQGRRDLTELARDLAARPVPLHAAVLPPLGKGLTAGTDDAWRTWLLGCPVADVEGTPLFPVQAALCFAPMVRKLPSAVRHSAATSTTSLSSPPHEPVDGTVREQEKYTLALWAARHRDHFDAVVLGPTSRGHRGRGPVYEEPAILAEDVRAMDALGFTDVGISALEGMLFGPHGVPTADLDLRPDVDRWLHAAFGDG